MGGDVGSENVRRPGGDCRGSNSRVRARYLLRMRATDVSGGEAAETGVEQTVAYGGGVRGSSVRVEGRRGARAGEGRACPSPVTLCLSWRLPPACPTPPPSIPQKPPLRSGRPSCSPRLDISSTSIQHRQTYIQPRILMSSETEPFIQHGVLGRTGVHTLASPEMLFRQHPTAELRLLVRA